MLAMLREFFSRCMSTLHFPKIWNRADVIAIFKPNKSANDAKNYRLISLYCMPLKLLKHLLLTRLEPVIYLQHPLLQAGFCRGRSTTDQVTLLTDDIEEGFELRNNNDIVLVDLTDAIDTVWLQDYISSYCRRPPMVIWCVLLWSSYPTVASNCKVMGR